MKTKIIFGIVAIILIASTIAGCTTPAEVDNTIKIGINIWPGYAYAQLAQEKGIFEKNGVDVEFIVEADYSKSIEHYINKEVDGVFSVYADAIFQNSQGVSGKVVYIIDYSDSGDVIIGKGEFNSLDDLKGKKISVDGINTFSHLFVLESLENAGISEIEVQFDNTPAMELLNALNAGEVDAGHTWEPIKSQALAEGYKVLAEAGDIPGLITDVLIFSTETIEEHPQEILAIIKSLVEARDFVFSNYEEAAGIMAELQGMTTEEMSSGLAGVHLLSLDENVNSMIKSEETTSLYKSGKIILDFYLKRGQLSAIPDLYDIIEPKFVNELFEISEGSI